MMLDTRLVVGVTVVPAAVAALALLTPWPETRFGALVVGWVVLQITCMALLGPPQREAQRLGVTTVASIVYVATFLLAFGLLVNSAAGSGDG